MWIEAENGNLYNTAHILRLALEHTGGIWRLRAELAFVVSTSSDSHAPQFPMVTLKTFTDENEALAVVKNLRGRLEKVAPLSAPRSTG